MKLIWNGTQNQNFQMQFPILKSEQLDDGRLMVEGIATSEALDHAGEIVDYESAKAAFGDWKGNIREQHDPKKAVGKAVEIICDDDAKQIIIKAFISKGAPDTQEKIKDGTLTGFSIGGSVGTRKAEKVSKADGSTVDATRITVKRISETSVVDAGCNPDTAITIVKAEGESLLGIGLEDAADQTAIDTLAELLNKGMITPERLIELAKADKPPVAQPLKKSMWSVQDFAGTLMTLGWICRDSQDEANYEGDGSAVPAQLRSWLAAGIKIFQDMAAEESSELLASLKTAAGEIDIIEMAQRGGDLAKGGKKFSKDTRDKLGKAHQAVKDASDQLDAVGYDGDAEDGGDDKQKSARGGDLVKVQAANDEITKALNSAGMPEGGIALDFVKAMIGAKDVLEKRVKELEAMPAPGKALLKAISKNSDVVDSLADKSDKPEPVVKDAHGNVNEVASLIKASHQSGGALRIG